MGQQLQVRDEELRKILKACTSWEISKLNYYEKVFVDLGDLHHKIAYPKVI